MSQDNFMTTFTVQQPAQLAFKSIISPQEWWSGDFEGASDRVRDMFVYRYKDLHYSKQLVTEFVPWKHVAWQVTESQLNFLENKSEWTGTTITFDVESYSNGTKVTFTHIGLKPVVECYDTCTDAWTSLIQGSLRRYIETGNPEQIELASPAF